MHWLAVLAAALAVSVSACDRRNSATSFFGPAHVMVAAAECAGRATLTQGTAEVKDSCFTGDTNIVVCTDVTSASAIRCTPRKGTLEIAGTGSDVIAYGRLR